MEEFFVRAVYVDALLQSAALAARVVSVTTLALSSKFAFATAAPDTWLQVSLDDRWQGKLCP